MARVTPLLFAISGAVALGLEAAWFRRLLTITGAAASSTGALLAIFMSGLAIGGALGARLVRSDEPSSEGDSALDGARALRRYAACEAVVSVAAMLSVPALALVQAQGASLSSGVLVLLAALVLLAPTVAMGATTPLLVASLATRGVGFQRALATLYSCNLAGACAGALISGYGLLPRLGTTATIRCWSLTASVIAVVAFAMARTVKAPHEPSIAEKWPTLNTDPDPGSVDRKARTWAVGVAITLGLLSFALQVSLGRVAALLLGSTAYTFELLAATILASLAVGATRARDREDALESWSNVSRRTLRVAVAVFLSMLIVRAAPLYLQLASKRGSATSLRWVILLALGAWPYLEIGAIFPSLASRMRVQSAGQSGGLATAVTTVGNVVGALVAGFVTIPLLGLQWTLRGVALGALMLAVVSALRAGMGATEVSRAGRLRLRGTLIAAAIAVVFGVALDRPWDAVGLSAGTYRRALNRSLHERVAGPCGVGRRLSQTKVLFHRDGSLGTVTVLSHTDGDRCTLYGMRVNGKTEGSVFVSENPSAHGAAATPMSAWLPVGDLPSQLLPAQLLTDTTPHRSTMIIGWGTGITARSLVDRSERTIVAEIEPAVLEAARFFDATLESHRGLTLLRDDGRRVLNRMPEASLDAIVSHPSNPWVTGATTLFSREFFELARSRLKPNGTMVAWVQLYEIDLRSVQSLVRTFTEVFHCSIAVRAGARSRDLFLLGSTAATIDSAQLSTRVRAVPGFEGFTVVGERAALLRWTEGARVVTDDNALLEYEVADQMLSGREDPRVLRLEGL